MLQSNSLLTKILRTHPDMRKVATLVLAGGAGKRLEPLTMGRCKPALTFAGKYRLIDIALCNALSSGCQKIFVLTQFLSNSLHRHITKNYCSVELLSVEQKPNQSEWYEGTADAVRKNIEYISEAEVEYFLILSGDQIYQMDLEAMAAHAIEQDADLLIAATPVSSTLAKRMGILQVDNSMRITGFQEKPMDLPEIADKTHLGSMGIYLFKRTILLDLLNNHPGLDFGKDLIPELVMKGNTFAYKFSEYWEDVGTIESYYQANMDLLSENATFNLHSLHFPLKSTGSLPPAQIRNAEIHSSLICEGSYIHSGRITRSIVGPQSKIGTGSHIDSSYIFGKLENCSHACSIGNDCIIQKAIIDNNVTIGNGVKLINQHGLKYFDHASIAIRDGIIIVKQGAIIPDHFII